VVPAYQDYTERSIHGGDVCRGPGGCEEFSQKNDVTTLSDFGELDRPVALAVAPDCLKGLEKVYGLEIGDVEPLEFGSPQTKDALTSGEVQVEQLGLVVLEGDKDWQTAENLVPVVSTEFLEANPKVEGILNELSDVLTTEDLMLLNAAVDAERRLAGEVATIYLQEKGLI
jgi:osmoprotectant transport system substrate-binding protein